MIIYTKEDENIIEKYKLKNKVSFSNKRFEDKITLIDVLNLLKRFNFKCIYCNDCLKSSTWQLDHFYAKASGGKNVIQNLAPACKWCNVSKNALDGYAFINRCIKIVNNNVLMENGKVPFHN